MSASPDRLMACEDRSAGWVLRLLTGLQQGAEAPLSDGVDYVLGRDETCDLVLWDESVAPRHLALRAESGRVRVQALEQPLVLRDRLLEPDGVLELATAATLRAGVLVLAVGPSDTDWSGLMPPDTPSPAGSNHAPDEPPEIQTEPDAGTPQATPVAPETIADSPDIELPTASAVTPSRTRLVRMTALIVAGSLLIVLLILLGVLFETGSTPEADRSTEATSAQNIERARALAQRAGIDDIEIDVGPSGLLTLHGYSATRAQRDALTEALLAEGLRADNRLWPEDVLHETLRETLERLGARHLSYDYRGQGEVRVQGILRPGLTAERLARTLQDDIPGIRRVVTELQPIAPLLQDLREELRAARLDQKLTLTSEEPPVTLSGRLNAREMEHLTAIRDRLAARYPELPPLVSSVMLDAPQASPAMSASSEATVSGGPCTEPLIRVVGVLIGTGKAAYAILESGEQVRRGERIGGRYVVEEIRFDRVIARADGQQHIFPVGVSHR
ncbi:type III secretion system inner membrane ring subunit SctD [Allochromatium palmeri]|uniref:EscD/YscD/HrpQ family type III secretion system inner membrane ring protein n=1 Tax=Allochromatium palmeri TaxID=231048 RepID=A0A6N8EE11_9GAMM|nr:type III secretion system inner membrane ring subunit SctD [Allochromatium palmeri]MTW22492.1 EscD/YscD/HrpQ family type III secretion system inner membrane ring protein [Allochromatium palmeri]